VQAASATQSAAVLLPQRKLLLMLRLLMKAQVGRGLSDCIYTALLMLTTAILLIYTHIFAKITEESEGYLTANINNHDDGS
jgi:hypothetical protein